MSREQARADDSIEIHFDPASGNLVLLCDPAAFERFRKFVAEDVRDVPEIEVDRIRTIEIFEIEPNAQDDDSLASKLVTVVIIGGFVLFATLVVLGAWQLISWIVQLFW